MLILLAQNLIDTGMEAEAIQLLQRAAELAPDCGAGAYELLAQCTYYKDISHPHLVFIRRQLDHGNLPAACRATYHAILGRVFDQLGRWDEAFAHFKAMNDLDRKRHLCPIKELINAVDKRIATFDESFFKARADRTAAPPGENLIFVLGMARSGTTLVEQILASHPSVHGVGETFETARVISELCTELKVEYPDCCCLATPEMIGRFGELYSARLALRNPASRPVIVDKTITNWLDVGFLATLFPRARFVYVRRAPLDTCFSCYVTNFLYLPHTNDLGDIATYQLQCDRLMLHWREIFGAKILHVQYEDLVRQPRPQIARLLNYCNLPWHEGCLSPNKTERAVFTSSATQVKRPISTRSIGRCRAYASQTAHIFRGRLISSRARAYDSPGPIRFREENHGCNFPSFSKPGS